MQAALVVGGLDKMVWVREDYPGTALVGGGELLILIRILVTEGHAGDRLARDRGPYL